MNGTLYVHNRVMGHKCKFIRCFKSNIHSAPVRSVNHTMINIHLYAHEKCIQSTGLENLTYYKNIGQIWVIPSE